MKSYTIKSDRLKVYNRHLMIVERLETQGSIYQSISIYEFSYIGI